MIRRFCEFLLDLVSLLLNDATRACFSTSDELISFYFFLMSRRNNKIATQAETADLFSALSEAADSSSSSVPVHATRGASAALLAKEIIPNPQPVATSSSGLGFRSFSPVASQSITPASSSLFLAEDDLPPSNQLEVSQIVPETTMFVTKSPRCNDFARGNAAAEYTASEYGIFLAAHVA